MKIMAVLFSLVISTTALAGTVTTKITRIGAVNDQYAIVIAETAIATKPACAEEYTILSFDKSTLHGRDLYSMALTALAAQKRLIITYSDTLCGLSDARTLVTRMDILND